MVAKTGWLIVLAIVLTGCMSTGASAYAAAAADPTELAFRRTELAVGADATASALRIAEARAEAAAASAESTAMAARWQATQAAYERSAESTRESLELTQTAEATQAAINASSTAMAWTVQSTQIAWTQSAIDVQVTQQMSKQNALATSQSVQAGIAQQALEREVSKTSMMKAVETVLPWLLMVMSGALVLGTALAIIENGKTRVIARGADGKSPVLVVSGKVVAPDQVLHPVTDIRHPQLAETEVHMRLAENLSKVDSIRALSAGGKGGSAGRIAGSLSEPASVAAPKIEVLPTTPVPWQSLNTWHPGGSLPLGLGAGNTGIMMNLDKVPHLMIAGTSGSGKTMCGLRPVAAEALVSGFKVIVMNDAGGDFQPLAHANLTRIEDGENHVADALESIALEVSRRSNIMIEAQATTWTRMPNWQECGPKMMIVIDELVAMATRAGGETEKRIWKSLIYITSKGRKFSMHVVVATTDPTYKSLGRYGLMMRQDCGRMAFRMRDASCSRAALDMDGAELLGDHQFIAQLSGAVQRGVAFHPSDDDLRTMLATRNVPQINGMLLSDNHVEVKTVEERIRELAEQGLSMNEIQRRIFNFVGGSAYNQVKRALSSNTGSNTTVIQGENRESEE